MASLRIVAFALLLGASSAATAQGHECKIPLSIDVGVFDGGEVDQLHQFAATIWPSRNLKLGDFVREPELTKVTALTYLEMSSCSRKVNILLKLLPAPRMTRSGIAKMTAKISKAAAQKSNFNKLCVIPIAGSSDVCVDELMQLPNNSFKPKPLRGSA